MKNKKIILASQSPRRKQLLEWADVDFEVIASDIEETWPKGLTEEEVAMHIARNKALDVRKKLNSKLHYPILAADTIVVLDKAIIGKPKDRDEAAQILTLLSGRIHHVITGICIINHTAEILFADKTEVEFYKLTESQINYYVDNYQPFDKAGAYAIQEWIGVIGIKSIKGDFYNVMGLPVSRVVKTLEI